MENHSSSTSQESLLFSNWHRFLDPLSNKYYFYDRDSQISQWTDSELGVAGGQPAPRASLLIGSARKKRIQDVIHQISHRPCFGFPRMEIDREKEQITAISMRLHTSGTYEIPDIVAHFADLVDSLEKERQALVDRHHQLANFIGKALSPYQSSDFGLPGFSNKIVEDCRDAFDVAKYICMDLPPPPHELHVCHAGDRMPHLQKSRTSIEVLGECQGSTCEVLALSKSSLDQVTFSNISDQHVEERHSSQGQISASETRSSEHFTEDTSATKRTRKRLTQKAPKQKDLAKFKHQCDFPDCRERFTRSTTLREHARIHSGERPFKCSECDKSFTRSKDRNRHQTVHTGKKVYLCGMGVDEKGYIWTPGWGCGQSFARKDQLAAHIQTKRGWRCIAPILQYGDLREIIADEDRAEDDSGYLCAITKNACQAKFDDLESFLAHLADIANRSCIIHYLVLMVLSSS